MAFDFYNDMMAKQADITINTDRWWKHGGTDNYILNNTTWDASSSKYIGNMGRQKGKHQLNGTYTTSTTVSVAHNYSYTTMDQFMRVRDVEFTATGLTPLATGFYLTFNGVRVTITPSSGYSTDTSGKGTVTTDSNGAFSGKFSVPSNVPVGTVETIFTNDKDSCVTTYTASGMTQHTGVYYTDETYFNTQYVTAYVSDPVAETFQLPQDSYVTSFDIPFGSVDLTEPVKFQLREVSNTGYPTSTVYANVTVPSANIKTSQDGSVLTNIKLPTPFLANANVQYAFVLASQSDNYTVFRAKLGELSLADKKTKCNSQPYGDGVMFTSSNSTTWTADHTADLKFNINIAKFNPTAEIVFDVLKNIKMDTFVAFSNFLTPNNTNCTWYYRMIGQDDSGDADITKKNWLPLAPFETTEADTIITQFQLKADFTATDFSSPVINMDSLSLGQFITALKGNYIGRTIDATQAPFNTIHTVFSAQLPNNAVVTPYYSLDGGNTWKQYTQAPTTTTQTNGYVQYAYTEKLSNDATSFKIKLTLSTQSSFLKPYVTNLMNTFNKE